MWYKIPLLLGALATFAEFWFPVPEYPVVGLLFALGVFGLLLDPETELLK